MVQEVQSKRGAGCEVRCVRVADCKGYDVQGVTGAGCIEYRVLGVRDLKCNECTTHTHTHTHTHTTHTHAHTHVCTMKNIWGFVVLSVPTFFIRRNSSIFS